LDVSNILDDPLLVPVAVARVADDSGAVSSGVASINIYHEVGVHLFDALLGRLEEKELVASSVLDFLSHYSSHIRLHGEVKTAVHVFDSEVLFRVSVLKDKDLGVTSVLCSNFDCGTCSVNVAVDLERLARTRVDDHQGGHSADLALTGLRILDSVRAALFCRAFTTACVWILDVRCAASVFNALALADLKVIIVSSQVAFVSRALVLVVVKIGAFADGPV
jgi:hypothetical protein